MSDPQTAGPPAGSLPLEPQSRSELLAATHVFSVEIVKVAAEPWSAQKDNIQQRTPADGSEAVADLQRQAGRGREQYVSPRSDAAH